MTFFGELLGELEEEEASSIENMICLPLYFMGLITICYLDNPLMKKPTKFIIIATSIYFIQYSLELVADLDEIKLIIFSIAVAVSFLVLELLKFKKHILEMVYELISVFAAIGWISIFSDLIIDFITFLSFYWSMNKIILNSLLLSAGNTVGDYFANAALVKNGEEVMGAIASYSGQIFNFFAGYSLTIGLNISYNDKEFKLF